MKPSSYEPQFLKTAIRIVSYLLVLLPAALGFLYVYSFGVNLVYGDSWAMVYLFDKLSSGTLSMSDLLTLHNGHLLLFPRIAGLSLGMMTEWNSIAEMYLTQVCFLATLICFLLVFRDSIKTRSAFLPLLMIPISLLVFSLTQSANMLRGFQIAFAFAEMFGVLALYLLYVLRYESLRKVAFVAALGSATVASFSAGAGIFVWPAGLLQLFISPIEKSTKRVFIALWGVVGLGEWIYYSIARANDPRGETGSMLSALAHPLAGIEYFVSLLGDPLFGKDLALAGGLFLACLALVSLLLVYKDRSRGVGEYSFWVSVQLWSFLILASMVAVKFARETELGLTQRYTTFTILAIVSIYGLLATTVFVRGFSIRRPSIRSILLVLLSGTVLLSGVAYSYPRGIKIGNREKEKREEAAYVLSTYESQPDEVLDEHFRQGSEFIREEAEVLERLGYNVFSESSKRGEPEQ